MITSHLQTDIYILLTYLLCIIVSLNLYYIFIIVFCINFRKEDEYVHNLKKSIKMNMF